MRRRAGGGARRAALGWSVGEEVRERFLCPAGSLQQRVADRSEERRGDERRGEERRGEERSLQQLVLDRVRDANRVKQDAGELVPPHLAPPPPPPPSQVRVLPEEIAAERRAVGRLAGVAFAAAAEVAHARPAREEPVAVRALRRLALFSVRGEVRGEGLGPLEPVGEVERLAGGVGRCGEMWGDVGRCGEMWGDVGRDGESWGRRGRRP